MPALNLDLNYFDHPKTKRLIGLLGPGAESLPIRLWVYCGKYHHKDGDLTTYTDGEIESVAGWTGHPGRMVHAMLTVGFLDKTDAGLVVHDWQEHAGHFAAYHERAKMAAKQRWAYHTNATSNAPSNASGMLEAMPRQGRAGKGKRVGASAPFTPPTVDEVRAEVASRGYRVNPEAFVSYYEANGWRVGRNPMKSWQGAVRHWHSKEISGGGHRPVLSLEENERLRAAARNV